MKENISLNLPTANIQRSFFRSKLFTEKKENSAFKLVVPDVEVMICYETLAPSTLEKDLVSLERDYKEDFRTFLNLNPKSHIVI